MKFTVEHVMTQRVVTVNAKQTIDNAFDLLLRHHVSGLPVIDDENHLVGVISEMDLLKVLFDPHTEDTNVVAYSSTAPLSVHPWDLLPDVVEILLEKHYRRLPVVDSENRLLGVISRRDVVRFIRDMRIRIKAELEQRREKAELAKTS
jgi:CBS domain-containing protein